METLTHKELEALLRITTAQVAITSTVEGINLDDLCGKMLRMHEAAAGDPGLVVQYRPGVLDVLVQYTNNKVGAIKLIRELTGLGLKESKDIADTARHEPSTGMLHAVLRNIRRDAFNFSLRSVQSGYNGVWISEFKGPAPASHPEPSPRWPFPTR